MADTCFETTQSVSSSVVTEATPEIDLTSFLPTTSTIATFDPGTLPLLAMLLPDGIIEITLTVTTTGTAPGPPLGIIFWDASGIQTAATALHNTYTNGPSGTNTIALQAAPPAGAAAWTWSVGHYFSGGTLQGSVWDVTQTLSYTCGRNSAYGDFGILSFDLVSAGPRRAHGRSAAIVI